MPLCAKHLTRARVNRDILSSCAILSISILSALFPFLHRGCVPFDRPQFLLYSHCLRSVWRVLYHFNVCVCVCAMSAFKMNVFNLLSVYISFYLLTFSWEMIIATDVGMFSISQFTWRGGWLQWSFLTVFSQNAVFRGMCFLRYINRTLASSIELCRVVWKMKTFANTCSKNTTDVLRSVRFLAVYICKQLSSQGYAYPASGEAGFYAWPLTSLGLRTKNWPK